MSTLATYEIDHGSSVPLHADRRAAGGDYDRLRHAAEGWGGVFDGKRVWWTKDGAAHHLIEVEEAA